jgi:hypothetical protein
MPTNAAAPATKPAYVPNIWDQKELGVMWKKEKLTTKEKYLTGAFKLGKVFGLLGVKTLEELLALDINFVVFSNKNKSKDTHPDLRIYWSEPRVKGASPTVPTARPAAAAPVAAVPDGGVLI